MKTIEFPLDGVQFSLVSSSFRGKADVIRLWMNAIKIMTAYAAPQAAQVVCKLVVNVDKMSRLFLSSDEKCVSVNFPFVTHELDGELRFVSKACGVVDNRMSSNILSLLSGGALEAEEVLEFAEPILELSDAEASCWRLLRDLIMVDDGYLRFDHDPTRENGRLHPLNHIDVFYSQSTTFKMGVSNKLALEDLVDILNLKSNCHFIAK